MELPTMSQQEFQRLLKSERETIDLPRSSSPTLGVPEDADVSTFPYSAAGKLFVWFPETPPDKPESCSAQFVGGATVILTAAHCLRHMNGVWVTRYSFFRAYRDGTGEQVPLTCPAVMTGWITSGVDQWKYDYAFLKTQTSSTGGFFGLDARTPSPSLEAIGYPRILGARYECKRYKGQGERLSQATCEWISIRSDRVS